MRSSSPSSIFLWLTAPPGRRAFGHVRTRDRAASNAIDAFRRQCGHDVMLLRRCVTPVIPVTEESRTAPASRTTSAPRTRHAHTPASGARSGNPPPHPRRPPVVSLRVPPLLQMGTDEVYELPNPVGRGRGRSKHIRPGLVPPGQSDHPVLIRVPWAAHSQPVRQRRAAVRMVLDRHLDDVEPAPVSGDVRAAQRLRGRSPFHHNDPPSSFLDPVPSCIQLVFGSGKGRRARPPVA